MKPTFLPLKWLVAAGRRITYGIVQCGDDFPGGVPYIRPVDMDDERGAPIEKLRRTSPEIAAAYKRSFVRPGDLIVSIGPSFGKVMVARPEHADANLTQGTALIAPGPLIHPRFLFWALRSPASKQFWDAAASGATFRALTLEILERTPIPTFELSEQRAVADFLDRETTKVDDLITRKQHLLALLQSRQEAVVRQIVVGQDLGGPKRGSGYYWLGDIPSHWTVLALKRIAKRVVVGIAEASTHAYADSGVPLVRTTNVKANNIDTSDLLYINREFADKNRSKYMRAGDIVTARTGNPGISGVIPTELDGSQCFTMLITTLREDHVPEFFCYYINSEPARTYFALEGWGTAQINISVPILQMLPVPCPPEKEQRQVAERIKRSMEGFERQVNLINEAIERLREYRSSLIFTAITGQIDIRNYRPQEAAVLCQ